MRMKSPTVTITIAITDLCCTGRMKTSWIATPSANAMPSVRKNAAQYERPHSVSW